MEQTSSFTGGSIFKPLIRFTLPILAALILQSMYGAADLMVVGRFGTAADVSAVSTGSQIMGTVTMLITALSVGSTVLLGQSIGRGDREEAGNVIGGGVCLFALIGVGLTVAMLFLAEPFVRLMHAPEEAFSGTMGYVLACSLGLVLITAYNLLGSVFRGMGDSKTPLFAVLVATIANIVLDLLFVAVFHMAALGAAIATVLAQGVSVVLSLLLIRRKGLPFAFGRRHVRFHRTVILQTLKLGVPVALQELLVGISFLVILSLVNSLGLIFSAGVGVAEKLCAFIMLVPSAYSQSLSAFVAQNIGAGKRRRAQKSMCIGMATSFCFGVVMALLSFFCGAELAMLFTSDPAVAQAASEYLRAYAIDTMLVSFLFCFIGYFNGCGRTTFVMAQGIIGAFCVRIPVSFLMSRILPASLFRIGLATPASTVVQIVLFVVYFLLTERARKDAPAA